jgi:tetratricopeptide (TPR) repeat protein
VARRNIKTAGSIAIELKYNAFALNQAAVCLLHQGGLSTYLDAFKYKMEMVLAERPLNLPELPEYTLSIFTAIQTSFDQLPTKTQDLLRLFSCLDRTQVSENIIIDAASTSFLQKNRYLDAVPDQKLEAAKSAAFLMELFCPNGRWSPLDIDQLVSPAIDYSLLDVTTTADNHRIFAMHSLVQTFLQDGLGDRASHYNRLAVRLLVSPIQFRDVGLDQHLLPHVRQFLASSEMTPFDHLAFAWVLRKGGSSKQAAEHLCEALRLMASGTLHLDIPFTLRIKQDLAGVYRDMGKFSRAADLGHEVMDMWKKLVGEEHPDTIISINNLAVTLSNKRHFSEAADLQRQALVIQKKVLGTEHRDTLTTMMNLAVTLSYQGKYTEAIDLERKTLEIQRRILQEDHVDTIKSMNNLGTFLYQQRQYKEASQLQKRVVELRLKHLGEEHPDTLKARNNLGTTLCQLGKYSEAANVQKRSVLVQRKLLGEDHPQVLTASHNLAFTLYKNQSYSESLALFEQVLKKRQKLLGRGHPETIATCRYVVAIYFQQGRNSQGEALLKEFGLRSR